MIATIDCPHLLSLTHQYGASHLVAFDTCDMLRPIEGYRETYGEGGYCFMRVVAMADLYVALDRQRSDFVARQWELWFTAFRVAP